MKLVSKRENKAFLFLFLLSVSVIPVLIQSNVFSNIARGFKDLGKDLEDVGKDIGHLAEEAAHAIAQGMEKAGLGILKLGEKIYSTVVLFAETIVEDFSFKRLLGIVLDLALDAGFEVAADLAAGPVGAFFVEEVGTVTATALSAGASIGLDRTIGEVTGSNEYLENIFGTFGKVGGLATDLYVGTLGENIQTIALNIKSLVDKDKNSKPAPEGTVVTQEHVNAYTNQIKQKPLSPYQTWVHFTKKYPTMFSADVIKKPSNEQVMAVYYLYQRGLYKKNVNDWITSQDPATLLQSTIGQMVLFPLMQMALIKGGTSPSKKGTQSAFYNVTTQGTSLEKIIGTVPYKHVYYANITKMMSNQEIELFLKYKDLLTPADKYDKYSTDQYNTIFSLAKTPPFLTDSQHIANVYYTGLGRMLVPSQNDQALVKDRNSNVFKETDPLKVGWLNGMYANLVRLDLGAQSDLSKGNFTSADMRYAILKKHNLSLANFTSANLLNADLTGANLQNTVLSGADLGDAKLEGADFTGAKIDATTNFYNVTFDSTTKGLLEAILPSNDGAFALLLLQKGFALTESLITQAITYKNNVPGAVEHPYVGGAGVSLDGYTQVVTDQKQPAPYSIYTAMETVIKQTGPLLLQAIKNKQADVAKSHILQVCRVSSSFIEKTFQIPLEQQPLTYQDPQLMNPLVLAAQNNMTDVAFLLIAAKVPVDAVFPIQANVLPPFVNSKNATGSGGAFYWAKIWNNTLLQEVLQAAGATV